jgi:hypothetical protein
MTLSVMWEADSLGRKPEREVRPYKRSVAPRPLFAPCLVGSDEEDRRPQGLDQRSVLSASSDFFANLVHGSRTFFTALRVGCLGWVF